MYKIFIEIVPKIKIEKRKFYLDFKVLQKKVSEDSKEIKERLILQPKKRQCVNCLPSFCTKQNKMKWKRTHDKSYVCLKPRDLHLDFTDVKVSTLSERGALKEAARCLKCADAPCQKACATQIDIKAFINCIANKNYYGAAKIIYSDNPLGIICGMVCPTSDLCVSTCNLHATEEGPINIGGLQEFAAKVFNKMGIRQTVDPNIKPPNQENARISIVGSGPASLSCASYLGRLGYKNIVIYEKKECLGGCPVSEIPQFRLRNCYVNSEIKLVEDLGIKIKTCQPLLKNNLTVSSLLKDSKAIFLGIGLPDSRKNKIFDGLTEEMGFYYAKDFLTKVASHSKPGVCSKIMPLPELKGKVVVLGGGDVAFDSATTALRCGAKKVYIIFREGFTNIKAAPEELAIAMEEKCELVGYLQPLKIEIKNGKINTVVFARNEPQPDNSWKLNEEHFVTVQANFIIAAFGSILSDKDVVEALAPLKLKKNNLPVVDHNTMETSHLNVWCGGDFGGRSGIIVDGVQDGKIAAWQMHCRLQGISKLTPCNIPLFHTEIDEVDLSVTLCGLKFQNPFGIGASSSNTTSSMIRRCLEFGWGFVVTKTMFLDKDIPTFVSPKIIRGTNFGYNYGPHQESFLSIEQGSDLSTNYWKQSICELKKDFPEKVIISSICCLHDVGDWYELAKIVDTFDVDALEINLSPIRSKILTDNGPEMVYNICRIVKNIVKVPFFVKLLPDVYDIVKFAKAAKEGGASGVTAIHAIPGLMDFNVNGIPFPGIGKNHKTTYGGICGNAIRPVALKAVSSIAKQLPGFPILGCGGISSADIGWQFLQCGATVLQCCSAVQNQDYSIINDYITGMKALLFLDGKLQGWEGQSPPVPTHQKGKRVHDIWVKTEQRLRLPNFGKHKVEKLDILNKNRERPTIDKPLEIPEPLNSDKKTIKDIIGRGLKFISTYEELNKIEKSVAVVNEEMCINCGKCYLACNDSGYQAIEFDSKLHFPNIKNNCTGCGLCVSVCPIPECIKMISLSEKINKNKSN